MKHKGYIESKTYEVYALYKGEYKELYLQLIEEDILIDLSVHQLFHGNIEEYMEYCGYQIESITERNVPYDYALEVVDGCAKQFQHFA